MGRGEYKGLVAALIIFGVLWVVLGVTTVVFFNQFNEMEQKFQTAEAARASAEQKAREEQQNINRLKLIIGVDENTPVTQIQSEIIEEDMTRYGEGLLQQGALDPTEFNYRMMLDRLEAVILASKADALTQKTAAEDVQDSLKQTEDAAAAKLRQAQQAQQKAADELNQEKTKHTQELQQLRQGYDGQIAQLRQTINQFNKEKEQLITDKGRAESQLAQARGRIDDLSRQLAEYRGETPVPPDGQITLVDNRTGTVYINLGSADGLPERLTFSVYSPETSEVTQDTRPRGAIEVSRIVGEHLAQARITQADVLKPLRPGDRIHTPSWKPGAQQKFALAGFLDIDGDGQADNAALRLMIERAGGRVVAEIESTGDLRGELTDDTNFLILGQMSGAAAQPLHQASSDLESAASRRGVKVISLDQFLDMSGHKRGSRVYQPGSGRDYNLRGGRGGY